MRDARAAVLDREAEAAIGGRCQLDPKGASTVVAGVVEQVAEDTFEAHLVERDVVGCAVRHDDRDVGLAEPRGDPAGHVGQSEILHVEVGGAGVESSQLEEVDHHAVEPADLADHHVERLLGSFREFVAAGVEHLDGRRECRDRRAQLVADIGRETCFAFDAGLDGVGHLVERTGETVEVGVGLGREAGVEPARGDLLGGVGDLAEWSEEPTAGGEAEESGEHERAERSECQCREDRGQGRLGVVEREGLVVAGVVLGDVHADGQVVRPVDRGVLGGRIAVADGVDEFGREVAQRMAQVGEDRARCRRVGPAEHGETARVGAQFVVDVHPDPVGVDGELFADGVGVRERLLLRCDLVVVEQVAASEAVGDADQDDAGEQGDEREEERDAGPKTKGTTSGHGDRVLHVGSEICFRRSRRGADAFASAGSPAAGEVPGGGRHPTGAA